MKDRIGVIVPVYKTEKYVAECIESILAQTYTNFRLILVDDGSPDNAGAICDEYAKKDSRITVIHQENAGVTRARARGVEEASDCDWITFVDSDDKIMTTYLKSLYNNISDNTDIVLCTHFFTETSNNYNWLGTINLNRIDNPFKEGIIKTDCQISCSKEKIDITLFRKLMVMQYGSMPWGRLFRKSIINDWAFQLPRDIYWGEDSIMNLRIAFNTKKDVVTLNEALYFYRQGADGVCNNFKLNPSYEEDLRKHCYTSIPKEEFDVYKGAYLYRRIFLWRTLFNNCIYPSWANTPFHHTLKREIKQYSYNLTNSDKLLILYTNPILRCIIICSRKILSFFGSIATSFKNIRFINIKQLLRIH